VPDGLVSVIVAAYNAEAFIAEALDSALAQDYRPLEVIVVDDGSADRTAEIAARYDVKLVRQPNRGPAAARNAALDLARGKYVAILDADDVWPEDRLSVCVKALRDSPDAGLVLGMTEVFVTPGEPLPGHYPHGVPNPAWGYMPALVVRRSLLDDVGRYDERLRTAEDIDWFMRARDAGAKLVTVEEVVLRHRIHAHNTSRHKKVNQAVMPGILRASLKRRRDASSCMAWAHRASPRSPPARLPPRPPPRRAGAGAP